MTTEFKMVPVEPTNEMVAAIQDRITVTSRGGKIGCKAALRDAIAAAPASPQPIYDEAKERELFEAYCAKVGLPLDTLPSGEYLIPVTRFVSQGWHARAKAGEVGHE